MFIACGFAAQFLLAQTLMAQAPAATAQIDPAAVNAGRLTFVTDCSFCHGSDVRGGAEGGPDLTRSPIVAGDPTGQQLNAFLKVGRPPKMPSFSLSDSDVAAVSAFL